MDDRCFWGVYSHEKVKMSPPIYVVKIYIQFVQFNCRPKLICFWTVGQGARDSEKLSDETLKEHVTELFQRFLGNETSENPKEILR